MDNFRAFVVLTTATVVASLPLVKRTVFDDQDQSTVLPHCAKAAVISGEVVRQNYDTAEISVSTNIHLNLGLHETACFHVQLEQGTTNATQQNVTKVENTFVYNGSLLYAIEYKGLQQMHPIRQQYTFGVPQLQSRCICDCPGGENHCVIGYNYKNCSQSSGICVTTYHPHQPAVGCPYGEESELCCDVSIAPLKNVKYAAVYLSQPDTVAELRYRLYRSEKSGWILLDDHLIKVRPAEVLYNAAVQF